LFGLLAVFEVALSESCVQCIQNTLGLSFEDVFVDMYLELLFIVLEPDVGADFRPNVLTKFVTSNASSSNPGSSMESTDFGELLLLTVNFNFILKRTLGRSRSDASLDLNLRRYF
jgi:hypothetical protein